MTSKTETKRWRKFHFLDDLSFRKKMILMFLIGIMVPMIMQNVLYYQQTEKKLQSQMMEKLEEAMDDKAEKINASLSSALSLCKRYYMNETLYRYLDRSYDRNLDYLIQYQEEFTNMMDTIEVSANQTGSIIIYTDNDTLLNGSNVRVLDAVDKESLGDDLTYCNLQEIFGENGIYLRVAHENQRVAKTTDSRSVSIICEMDHYAQYSKSAKLFRIDPNLGYLENRLQESDLFENMLLTDTNGKIFLAANTYSNRGDMADFSIEELQKEKGLVVLSRKIGNFPVTLYGIYNSSMISGEFAQSRTLSIWISVACVLFALGFVYLIIGNIDRRLSGIVAQSKEIAKGNFVQREADVVYKDEFGELEASINRMSSQLEQLIEEEYKAELAKSELEKETNQARLLALQSQVNPHFMFNALESIRLKALVKGEKETAVMIRYMAKMFRKLIEWDNNLITLKEEISFLDEFLHIQNYRFEDEFSYEINVTDEAKQCIVPKMILQPLVENACVHGLEAVDSNRRVQIDAYTKDERLWIVVEDNGGGMTEEQLQALKDRLAGESNHVKSVGLWNVNRRLILYYGKSYQFSIESEWKKGTICTISIPVTTTLPESDKNENSKSEK